MNILLSLINYEKTYEKISKFPLVKRDISLVIKKSINFEDIKKIIKKIENSNIIKSVNIFDIYEGGNLKEDEKSYSLSFVLQETKDTLNSFLINKVINNIINSFKKDLFAIIRN
jgi:phenylalanyl-tRNA synthetase beta chain